MKEFYTVGDVQIILGVSRAKAYKIIRGLNEEMEEEGYKTLKGRVNKSKFDDRYMYKGKQRNGVV
ncbi:MULTISPECIES: ICEBs1 excisionase [Bacillus]|uniref:ICEBs1 excisionase n=1 Tax=Bacillus haynesii TaxID=1925021 RepID=A0ABX3I2S4_9BACI|nr:MULTISPECIES: ICEBs1 excisionase [Bacillus]MCY8013756.1 ICEBs1 excisionase [Bacillus haynesii]MCY8407482.1 ICEBs1 excisionase [Bacillus haynesii]MCY8433019.1 ICEBs1 excisionase [Bacillus haynesii]MEC0756381.1 ICEBs1 excisionase [Bacillus haynesii]OMI26170.1 ICEBs1 excisionase [Bacillus haynesii]